MSVTITDNATKFQIHQALQDYQIRLTGAYSGPVDSPNHRSVEQNSRNPENWPKNYRRIPRHRPINRNLDRSLRPDGTNLAERAFIFTMLHGVWLNATISQAWEGTGAKINPKLFRYKIGGEW